MKTYIGILASSILISTAGCNARPGMHYDIVIDRDSLTPDEQTEVVDAGEAWKNAVPGLSLTYTVDDCRGWNRSGVVCVFRDDGSPPYDSLGTVFGHTDFENDSAVIHLYSTCFNSKKTYAVFDTILHEIGHSIGQNSSHIHSGVMSPVENGSIKEVLTDADINYFWSMR